MEGDKSKQPSLYIIGSYRGNFSFGGNIYDRPPNSTTTVVYQVFSDGRWSYPMILDSQRHLEVQNIHELGDNKLLIIGNKLNSDLIWCSYINTIQKTEIEKRHRAISDISNFNIYPIPHTDVFKIKYKSTTSGKIQIKIYNMLGALELDKTVSVVKGNNIIELIDEGMSGLKTIILHHNNSQYQRKILKVE